MKIKLELNPDEALALIQVLERDILFPEVSSYVISQTEKARHEWANNVRNLAYLRAGEYVLESSNNLITETGVLK
jgi:hypothetical protein